jgi:hypothetical protein
MTRHDLATDPEVLRSIAADLDRMALKVEAKAKEWAPNRIAIRVQDPGWDPVSRQLGANMRTMAERAGQWLEEYARQVRIAQEAVLEQAASYERQEAEIAERLGRI